MATSTVRRVKPEELGQTFALIDAMDIGLQWEKYSLMYKACPESFYLIETGDGNIAGTVSFVEVLPKIFKLGDMVVRKELRGQGLGTRLVLESSKLFEHNALAVTIAPNTAPFYRSVGFKRSETLESHYFQIVKFDPDFFAQKMKSAGCDAEDVNIRPYKDTTDFKDLVAYDNANRCHDNSRYLSVLVQICDVVVARYRKTGSIAGFCAVHDGKAFGDRLLCTEGLYADSDGISLLLLSESLSRYPEVTKIKLLTLESNPFLRHVGEASRSFILYKFTKGGAVPQVPKEKVYVPCDADFTH